MKAIPGEYPLVVTGEVPRSSAEYQFDCEAVCIPLVSSTGHGHASIHRLHYQSGKFALANIMVALKPKPNAPVNMQFLHLYLTARKDELLVSLMAGTSNVSLRMPDLARVQIQLPDVAEQERVAKGITAGLAKLDEAKRVAASIAEDFDRLLIAMAHRDDLTDEEKVARGWRRVKLCEVMRLDLDPVKVDPSDEYPNLGIYSYARGAFGKPSLAGISLAANTLFRVQTGQFIYLKLNAYEGAYASIPPELDGYFVTNEFPTFTCDSTTCRSEWLVAHFKLPSVWRSMSHSSKGTPTRRQRVNPDAILAHEVWLPPMAEQNKIAEVLNAKRQYDALDTFEKDAEALRRSILSKAFRGEL